MLVNILVERRFCHILIVSRAGEGSRTLMSFDRCFWDNCVCHSATPAGLYLRNFPEGLSGVLLVYKLAWVSGTWPAVLTAGKQSASTALVPCLRERCDSIRFCAGHESRTRTGFLPSGPKPDVSAIPPIPQVPVFPDCHFNGGKSCLTRARLGMVLF